MPDLAAIRCFLEDTHHRIAEEAAEVAGSLASLAHAATDDAARLQSREILAILGDARLARYAVGENADHVTTDLRACCLIRETLAAASVLADSVFALQGLGSMPIVLAGEPSLRQQILPEVVAGRLMAAFAMTEPDAGSDVASMTTRATRDGDGWRLDGQKHLITNAGVADFYCVFAKTTPDAGARGITLFFVEADNPGCRFLGPQILSEPHPLGVIEFEACRVPDGHRLGPVDGGFRIGMRTLDRLRPTVAAAACGMAERALAEALGHTTSRHQFGAPLAELPATQSGLATMATELTASRLLVYRAAFEADSGAERTTLEAAMAKSFATEAAQRVIDRAVQLLGGRGCLASHPVDRLYRAVRALRIYEGATEVQHLVIARQILRHHAKEPPS